MEGGIVHTPYDGSSKPFTIGLSQLEVKNWFEVDANLISYLQQKRELYARFPERVIVSELDTRDAQREVLNLIVPHVLKHFPDQYKMEEK